MKRRVKVPLRRRMSDSRAILGQSARMAWRERHYWVFPAIGIAWLVPLAVSLFWAQNWPPLQRLVAAEAPWMAPVPALAAFVFLLPLLFYATVQASIAQTAYVYAIHERMEERTPTRGEAWRHARARAGVITRFSAIALVFSLLLQVLALLLQKIQVVPWLGRLVQTIGTVGWAAAAFFVIPVIAVEGEPKAFGALGRSTRIARAQWGKTLAGFATIMFVLVVPMMVLMALAMVAFAPIILTDPARVIAGGPDSFLVLLFLLLAPALLFVPIAMWVGAAYTPVYQTALYRFATTGQIPHGFDRKTLVEAWEPYQTTE